MYCFSLINFKLHISCDNERGDQLSFGHQVSKVDFGSQCSKVPVICDLPSEHNTDYSFPDHFQTSHVSCV